MEKMLVVVFENEKKAFEGTRALADLDLEGNIAVHAEAVIQKNQDGTVSMKQAEDHAWLWSSMTSLQRHGVANTSNAHSLVVIGWRQDVEGISEL